MENVAGEQGLMLSSNVQLQKISILPPQKGLEFPRGRGVL